MEATDLLTLAATLALSLGLGLAGTRAILGAVFLLMTRAREKPAPPPTVEVVAHRPIALSPIVE